MKKSNYFLLMLISISYSSILESDLIYFNNKFYSPNSHIPYSGKVVDYYSNKLISYEGTYLNGLKDGEFNYYYESGSIHKKEVYNLGNSSPISLNDFIALCEKVVGKKAIYKQIDNQLGDVPHTYADISKAKRDLGYDPKVGLEEGLNSINIIN